VISRRALFAIIAAAVVGAASFAGCSASAATSSANAAKSSATPATSAAAAGLTICYEDNAQAELIAPSGRRILIDVWSADTLSKPPTANDILLTTHSHGDHYISSFVDSFPGQKITFGDKTIKTNDVSIVAIPAVHDEGFDLGTDYIFVIEFAGFRIGHFGDLGYDKIPDATMAKIGKIDIAFSQLANSVSSMDDKNQKGINQMKQVKPLIFIPTHLSTETAQLAGQNWKATFSTKPITLTPAQLPTETTVVFMGSQAESYGTILKLKPSSW
jgi:hypothetical protein